MIFCLCYRDVTIPEARPKEPRKFFPSSPLNMVKKPDIFANKKPEPKRDDLLRMATMPKDSRQQKSSKKLLPVITRQKKPKPVSTAGNSQSHSFDSGAANQHSDYSSSQKVSNQKANHVLMILAGIYLYECMLVCFLSLCCLSSLFLFDARWMATSLRKC